MQATICAVVSFIVVNPSSKRKAFKIAPLLYRHIHKAHCHSWWKMFVSFHRAAFVFACLYKTFHCLEWANFITPFASPFQVMTSARRDSFVEKTRSVKTGILKQSVNARAAMPLSMGTLLIVKVQLYFTRLRLCRASQGWLIIYISPGCKNSWIGSSGWKRLIHRLPLGIQRLWSTDWVLYKYDDII